MELKEYFKCGNQFIKGYVFKCFNFDFRKNRPPKDKLVLFLNKNNPSDSEVVRLILPTSQQQYYQEEGFCSKRNTKNIICRWDYF